MTALQSSHFKDLKDGTGGGENGAMTALQSSHFTDLKVRVAEKTELCPLYSPDILQT